MIKLKKLLNEGEESKKFSPEVKKHFLEIVSTYNKYQEMMDRKSDIVEVAETLGGIIEAAKELAINEGDDWFDKHTVKRNMNELGKLGQQFEKVVVEAKQLDQRLGGLYEDMGHILSRYYKIGEITEDEMKDRLGMRNESKINEYDEWKNTKIQAKNIFRMLKQKYDNVSDQKKGLEDILKQNKTKPDQAKVMWDEFNKFFNIKEIKESADPNKFKKGFVQGDIIVNDSNSRYVVVQNKGIIYVVGDNGERRQQIKQGNGVKFGPSQKGNLGLQDISESLKESFTPQDIAMIKKVVDKEKRLIGLSPIFKKMGWHTDFVMMDSVPPHLKLKKKKNDKQWYLLVNKKYVEKPDWVSGEIAGGLDESKQSDCDSCGKSITELRLTEADNSNIEYSKDGYVKRALNAVGKTAKEINVDGNKYRYNSVYKTYNSIKGNELLNKSDIDKAKIIQRQ